MSWASRWTGLAAGPTLCAGAPASASERVRMVNGRARHPTAQRQRKAKPRPGVPK